MTGSSLAAAVDGYSNFTTTFPDGTTTSVESISGTVTTSTTMTVTLSATTSDFYQINFTYKNCTGNYAVLNDVEMTGLAVLDTAVSPQQLVIAMTGQSSSGSYGITSYLNAT